MRLCRSDTLFTCNQKKRDGSERDEIDQMGPPIKSKGMRGTVDTTRERAGQERVEVRNVNRED